MTVSFGDIPEDKTVEDYPDDTIFVLDDRPVKYHPETFKHIYPGQPGYEEALTKEQAEIIVADYQNK